MASIWTQVGGEVFCEPGSEWSEFFAACIGEEISPPGGPLVSVPIATPYAPIECPPGTEWDGEQCSKIETEFIIDYPIPGISPLETLIAPSPTDRTIPTVRTVEPTPLPISTVIPTVPVVSPAPPVTAVAPTPRVLAPGTPAQPPSGEVGFLEQTVTIAGREVSFLMIGLIAVGAYFLFAKKGR